MEKYVLMFGLTAMLDWVWAKYSINAAARNALQAAIYATLIYALGGIVAIGYIADHWLLIPAALGAFAGTYFAVRGGE